MALMVIWGVPPAYSQERLCCVSANDCTEESDEQGRDFDAEMDAFIDYYVGERASDGWRLVRRVYRARLRSPYRVGFDSWFRGPSPGPRDEVQVALIAKDAEEGGVDWNLRSLNADYLGGDEWHSGTASPDRRERNGVAALMVRDPQSLTRRQYLELFQVWSGFPDPHNPDFPNARGVNGFCVEAYLTAYEPHPAYLLVFFR
jgi:hypothetical protein